MRVGYGALQTSGLLGHANLLPGAQGFLFSRDFISFWLQKFKDLQKAALWIAVVVITLVLLIQKFPMLTNDTFRNTVNL